MQDVNNREVVLQMITEIIFITAPAIVLQVDPTGGLMHPSGMSCLFPISATMLSVQFTSKKLTVLFGFARLYVDVCLEKCFYMLFFLSKDAGSECASEGDDDDGEEEEEEISSTGRTGVDQKYDEDIDEAEEGEGLRRYREARANEMFPDEVDTPLDVPAKTRYDP